MTPEPLIFYRMDKKSLQRLLVRLAEEGQIKNLFVKINIEQDSEVINKTIHLVCDPSVDERHQTVRV